MADEKLTRIAIVQADSPSHLPFLPCLPSLFSVSLKEYAKTQTHALVAGGQVQAEEVQTRMQEIVSRCAHGQAGVRAPAFGCML